MILVIDNFDSFTYNLVQYLGELGAVVAVRRNNEIDMAGVEELDPAGILMSPGPCTPKEAGVCRDISAAALAGRFAARHAPVFGVCLGHQTLGEMAGGTVRRAKQVMHGKTSLVEHDGKGLFAGVPSPFNAVRYHSLVVEESDLPPGFVVTARSVDDGEIQGFRHREFPIEGVQFHPESILTEHGRQMIANFVAMCRQP